MKQTMDMERPDKPEKMDNYLLRDIPPELWTSVRHLAVDKRVSLRELILEAMALYLQGQE